MYARPEMSFAVFVSGTESRGFRFAENVIKKYAHKNLPFLDDPYN